MRRDGAKRQGRRGRGIGARLKAARGDRRLSLRELARRADLSASLLSLVENGKTNPSVESLYRIASALGTSVTDLFADTPAPPARAGTVPPAPARPVFRRAGTNGVATAGDEPEALAAPMITRRGDRPTLRLMGGIAWSRLTARPAREAEFIETVYPPGSSSGTEMSHHQGREFALVLEGQMTLELGFERFTLGPGDSILYSAPTPHRVSNRSRRPMRALWVVMNAPPRVDLAPDGARRARTR
jgi:transcriptional regulator with XRE-family HTH domain/quercetin dioxygenase-like cupin family protein